ncbi:MAG: hypothetical protein KDA68_23250, partial [Planctomycetaceae bacterium]|nr:hypothetical protein [Planctomycetaceae bacterium]
VCKESYSMGGFIVFLSEAISNHLFVKFISRPASEGNAYLLIGNPRRFEFDNRRCRFFSVEYLSVQNTVSRDGEHPLWVNVEHLSVDVVVERTAIQ